MNESTKNNMNIFLLDHGRFRGGVLDATEMVKEMQAAHTTGVLETFALGESYIAAGLLSAMLKGNDRLALVLECGGPIGGINVEVNAAGDVRAYLKNNPFPLDEIPESLDLSMLFGPGFLSVTKYLENSKQPFTGQVMITYGSIAKDLAYYYTTSENLPTAFNLSVKFNKDGSIKGAGGVFIQKMPDEGGNIKKQKPHNAADIASDIEKAVTTMESIGISFAEGKNVKDLILESFGDFSPDVVGVKDIKFNCSCSRELFSRYLAGLKKEDQDDILEKGPFPLLTTCHNCNTEYSFTKNQLSALFSSNN